MSKYCDAILVNERNLGKSGEKGASQAEPEAGYLGWQNHGGIKVLIGMSILKVLCKSREAENYVRKNTLFL